MKSSPERFTTENFLKADMPTVQQLNQLADVWQESARERQVLKGCFRESNGYFSRDILETPFEINGELAMLRHSVGMYTGLRDDAEGNKDAIRVMKYNDSLRLVHHSMAGAAIRHMFMWTEERVIRARRTVSVPQTLSEEESDRSFSHMVQGIDTRVGIYLPAEAATALAGYVELSEVSRQDCQLLIATAQEHFVRVGALSAADTRNT